jgi:alpha-amylase/alpha-mannosidase (GH57 family)
MGGTVVRRPELCIHGHFYQPPRENPWTGRVESQPSAAPAHDWNERITEECYRPNAEARLLADEARGLPPREISNYSHMSFDFGPTLLAYLSREQRDVHDALIAADREACRRFHGHGSAIAQSYSHSILPLASSRDRRTEVRWGLLDFELRFGRPSEGLWLPECAVDTATLEALADEGLRFTVLAPGQARAVRRIGAESWTAVGADKPLDTRMPYLVRLGAARSIAVFFYDGALAHNVAFGQPFRDGAQFLAAVERDRAGSPGLVHFATDGETYGHHQRFGEMGLAWMLERVTRGESAFDLTVYGHYLDRFPPTHEVEINEKSSWSCAHGVERWRSDCGCSGGRRRGSQSWRGPLRDALDFLRDLLAPIYEREIETLLDDPWGARDRFAEVLVRRTPRVENLFLERESTQPLAEPQRLRALQLLDMQRHALLMYASCAWFFDDLSDIEALQALAHAARAIELAGPGEVPRLERHFRAALTRAAGNDGATGEAFYDRVVDVRSHGETGH